jgi:hypothetical protein
MGGPTSDRQLCRTAAVGAGDLVPVLDGNGGGRGRVICETAEPEYAGLELLPHGAVRRKGDSLYGSVRRSGVILVVGAQQFGRFKWRWIACAICALHGVLNHVTVRPHELHWGYGLAAVDWLPVLAPLLVAGVAHVCERPKRAHAVMSLTFACLVLTGCASSKVPQHRGWIGGEYKPARHLKDGARGLLVTALRTNAPAARSGLREGDLIIRAGGKSVNNLAAFQRMVDAAQAGGNVPMSVLREGAAIEVNVRAGCETFAPTRAIVIGLLMSHEWDPWPNPDFSLVAFGFKQQHKRVELDSPESRFRLSTSNRKDPDEPTGLRSSEGWEIWLPVVSFSSRKRILSQSDREGRP